MAKRTMLHHEPVDPAPPPPDGGESPREALEQRVQRLEDAVASLQDTRPLEERLLERVTERLAGKASEVPEREPARIEHMIAAERRTAAPRPVEDGFAVSREVAPPPPADPPPPSFLRHPWLLFDTIAELRAMFRMFFDVRYHVAWSTRLTVLILLPLIFVSGWLVPLAYVPLLGPILDKIVDLVLAFFAFKALSREARRYMQVKAGRPQTLR